MRIQCVAPQPGSHSRRRVRDATTPAAMRAGSRTLGIGTILMAGLFSMGRLATALDVVVVNQNMIQITEQQLVQWVFQTQQTVPAARKHAENSLNIQVDFVALIGTLTDEQRAKLELAGRGDVHRFFEDFNKLLKATPLGQMPQQQWQEVWQKMQPLQVRYMNGLHGQKSLFRKTIPSTLSEDQLHAFQVIETERNRRRYLATVKATLATIEGKIPLTARQREQVIALVMEKTKPPRAWGQGYYRYHVVLYQMSTIEDDLKPVFRDDEWKLMTKILQQGQMVKHMLRQQGGIEFE